MDNWKHRSKEMTCGSCMWFVEKRVSVNKPEPEITSSERVERGRVGRCRKHAPTMNGFPVVWQGDWCGDHKLDETKVS